MAGRAGTNALTRARRRWQPFESRRESCVKRYDNELIGGSFLVADSNSSAESSFGVLPVGRRDHRRFEFVAAGFWRSSLWRIQSKTVRLPQKLPLGEQINCEQREQKVGNKHRSACIIFRDSLPEKQRGDRCGGKNCSVQSDP